MQEKIKEDDYTIRQIIGEYEGDNEKMKNEKMKNEKRIEELELPQIINRKKIKNYELELEALTKEINDNESDNLSSSIN